MSSTEPTQFETDFKEMTSKRFTDFYENYRPKLVWLLQNIIKDPDEAQDIAQDAFMHSLTKIHTYNPQYHYSTWLFNIARNMAFEMINKRKRLPVSYIVDAYSEDGHSFCDRYEDTNTSDINETEVTLKDNIIRKHINGLDEKYRTVVEMKDVHSMPYRDISYVLELNENTIKSQVRQARIRIREVASTELAAIGEEY